MRCLVTGGAGFIGSNLVDRLIAKNVEVIVIDDESATENSKFYWNKNAKNYKDDICNYNNIEHLFKNVDYVFHLAAQSRIQPSIVDPTKTLKVNCEGTLNVLNASKKHNVSRFIYSSTSSYYGLNNKVPFTENLNRDCLNPYSYTKIFGEDLCKMYHELYDMQIVILRYFNVYGQRQPTKGQYAPVVGIFQKQFKENKRLTIVGDGMQRRDYTHVDDVVSANILAAKNKLSSGFEVFNVGTGINYSVLDIAQMIGGEYKFIPERKGEAKETLADISKIKKHLNWVPSIKLEKWLKDKK
jgi:UDP-glucose 4-epimerase